MVVVVPPLFVFMPDLVRIVFYPGKNGAHEAASSPRPRGSILLAGALQRDLGLDEVVPRLDRPPGAARSSRTASRSVVLIPLVVVFGIAWGATGAAGAVLASTVVFCALWTVLLVRIHREPRVGPWPLRRRLWSRRTFPACEDGAVKVLVVSGIWPPDVGGPASHAPEVAGFLRGARARGRGRDDRATRRPRSEPYQVRWVSRRLPIGVRHLRWSRVVVRACAARGCRLHDRDARADDARLPGRADAVRGQADRRTPPSSGRSGAGSSRGGPVEFQSERGSARVAARRARPRAAPRRARRLPERVSARARRRLGRPARPRLGAARTRRRRCLSSARARARRRAADCSPSPDG